MYNYAGRWVEQRAAVLGFSFRSVNCAADVQTSFFLQRYSRDRQLHMNELGNRRMAFPLGVVYFGFW